MGISGPLILAYFAIAIVLCAAVGRYLKTLTFSSSPATAVLSALNDRSPVPFPVELARPATIDRPDGILRRYGIAGRWSRRERRKRMDRGRRAARANAEIRATLAKHGFRF